MHARRQATACGCCGKRLVRGGSALYCASGGWTSCSAAQTQWQRSCLGCRRHPAPPVRSQHLCWHRGCLRAATKTSPRATVLSVDAVEAFDHVARGSMLGALLAQHQHLARRLGASLWLMEFVTGRAPKQGDPLSMKLSPNCRPSSRTEKQCLPSEMIPIFHCAS